ncbi:MAG: serine/threonine protein kinase [Candidatus Brocadiae bacterium]|nr:serine/threonine protein kinase [Candidatus Brocadiia bacterium]
MEIPRKFSKYHILSIIGQGSMGTVFKAEQDVIQRIVAIKVLPIEFAKEDPRKVLRFEYEAKSAARLFHPNIITIYEVGKLKVGLEDIEYFVMQYFQGESLADLIDGKKLPLMTALSIFEQMASALEHAHQKEVVHRDIKPSNVLIDSEGKAILLDFGIAKIRESPDLTRAGYVIGSAPYMSPEQARGEKVDGRSDIFSLGVVVYEAFTGQRAFFAENKRDMILDRQMLAKLPKKDLPVPMRKINPEIPAYLESIVHKCMEGDMNYRYQNSLELLEDIQKCKLLLLAERKFYTLVPKLYYHRRNETNMQNMLMATIVALIILVIGIVGMVAGW